MGQGLRATWAVRVTCVPPSHRRSQVSSSLSTERPGVAPRKESPQKPWLASAVTNPGASGFGQGWEQGWGAGVQVMAWAWGQWPLGGCHSDQCTWSPTSSWGLILLLPLRHKAMALG